MLNLDCLGVLSALRIVVNLTVEVHAFPGDSIGFGLLLEAWTALSEPGDGLFLDAGLRLCVTLVVRLPFCVLVRAWVSASSWVSVSAWTSARTWASAGVWA